METYRLASKQKIQTLFISDIHLGSRFAQTEKFLTYINNIHPEKIYIIGDFLDGWKLQGSWRWNSVYTDIISRIVELASTGTELFYTPGNHDEFLRCEKIQTIIERTGINLKVQDEFVFTSRNGQQFLITHGDQFDVVEKNYQWLSMAINIVYEPLLYFNWLYSKITKREHSPYRMCAVIKDRVKKAVKFFSSFEQKLYLHARSRDCQGIICGHIHSPGVEHHQSMIYLNTGDWVENCTALVENEEGAIFLESFSHDIDSRLVYSPAIAGDSGQPNELDRNNKVPVPFVPDPIAAEVA